MARRATSTSAFGVSKRENHDSSAFYRRFNVPELSDACDVGTERALDKLIVGDSRRMDEVPDGSVALVVTSPPYFAGKQYEEALGEAGVPATYLEYLDLLRDVFAECVRKLEPGGRIAVNVANLGRRPYRSLSADVISILQDDLRLLLRGEIIWLKQRGSSGSCAWGSFQRPANPVLRDLTERVVVASKGRFDRAVSSSERKRRRLPHEPSMTRDDFMEDTLDVWEIPSESATRVGHPAPFPVELPARLIDLYTYREDLVLDPFAGAGTTAVAAVRAGRHYACYDLDESYVRLAETRVEQERREISQRRQGAGSGPSSGGGPAGTGPTGTGPTGTGPTGTGRPGGAEETVARVLADGAAAKTVARCLVEAAGFAGVEEDRRPGAGLSVDFCARDHLGRPWLFDVAGPLATYRPGLKRSDAFWKAIAKAAVLREVSGAPFVLLAAGGPLPAAAGALRAVTGPGKPVRAVVDMLAPQAADELRRLCAGARGERLSR